MSKFMTRPCPACDGEGSIQFQGRYSDHEQMWPMRWQEPCEECRGTGSLETDAPQELRPEQELVPTFLLDQYE